MKLEHMLQTLELNTYLHQLLSNFTSLANLNDTRENYRLYIRFSIICFIRLSNLQKCIRCFISFLLLLRGYSLREKKECQFEHFSQVNIKCTFNKTLQQKTDNGSAHLMIQNAQVQPYLGNDLPCLKEDILILSSEKSRNTTTE